MKLPRLDTSEARVSDADSQKEVPCIKWHEWPRWNSEICLSPSGQILVCHNHNNFNQHEFLVWNVDSSRAERELSVAIALTVLFLVFYLVVICSCTLTLLHRILVNEGHHRETIFWGCSLQLPETIFNNFSIRPKRLH